MVDQKLEAFVDFPSQYTTVSISLALTSALNKLSISPNPPAESSTRPPSTPYLAWADYDLIPHELIHSNPMTTLSSSYIYRKSLIRKHFLSRTCEEYLAKHQLRQSILISDKASTQKPTKSSLQGALPESWTLTLQFADELDEILQDEAYVLANYLRENELVDNEEEKKWFILKPSMADRGQGIRLFSTLEELEEIFQEFEDESDDEEPEEDESDGKAIQDDDSKVEEEEEEDDDAGNGVQTSQLRHFVVQEYISNPLLLNPTSHDGSGLGHKFHLRTYVCLTGAYTVLLSKTVLALFSSLPYSPPIPECSLAPHLTNTCLQPDASTLGDESSIPPENVLLLTELLNRPITTSQTAITESDIKFIFDKCGAVAAEAIKAAVECGSVHMQLMPNAFEIFGVDFLVSLPPPKDSDSAEDPKDVLGTITDAEEVNEPFVVSLLEFNASPDFHQSGARLQGEITKMFAGVVEGVVKPFFGLKNEEEDEKTYPVEWDDGEERLGWVCVGKGEVRRGW